MYVYLGHIYTVCMETDRVYDYNYSQGKTLELSANCYNLLLLQKNC